MWQKSTIFYISTFWIHTNLIRNSLGTGSRSIVEITLYSGFPLRKIELENKRGQAEWSNIGT